MNAAQLKASILQQAIEGKLVPQLPEEGIVEQIGDAPTEVPFEIPESWKWFKFPDFVSFNIGKTPDRSNSSYWDGDIPWVAIADITKSDGYIRNTKELISHCALEDKFSNKLAKAGSLLMSFKLSIGKVAFLSIDAAHNEGIISINPHNGSEDTKKFLFYALPVLVNYAETNNAIKGKTLNKNKIKALLIPVPPLAEQKRIVAKIEELMPLVEEYGKAYDKLQELNDELPGKLKASILQEAIQGKLVPQLPEDGVVEQIGEAPAEVPLEIPDSWKWIKLSDVVDVRDGTHDSPKYVEKGVPFVTSKNLKNGTIDFSTVKFISKKDHESFIQRSNVEPGDILMAMIGSIGNAIMVPENAPEFSIKNVALFKHKADKLLDFEFLLVLLKSLESIMNTQSSGSAQKFVPLNYLRNMAIPLPPLAEQKRIVAKVETLQEQIDLMTK